MLTSDILSALKIIYSKLKDKDIFWILTGSTSLAIQGVNISINDIDIITDKKGSKEIDLLLSEFRIKEPIYSSTETYRSYFGIYKIEKVKVEIMGEFQYKKNDDSWSNQDFKTIIKEFEGMSLRVLPLITELQEYENLDRLDTVKKIKEYLEK